MFQCSVYSAANFEVFIMMPWIEITDKVGVYVTLNMCNPGICLFTENFREYAHFLKFSGIRVFPGFVKQLLHIFTKLKSVNICNGSSLKFYTRNKLETSHINEIYLSLFSCLP